MSDGHEEGTCKAPRKKGGSCSNPADDDGYCWLHDESDGDIADVEDDSDADADAGGDAGDEDTSSADVDDGEDEVEAVDPDDLDLDAIQTKYVKVRNPHDEHKKAALIGFMPNETKTMRNGMRVKRAIERGQLEFIEGVPSHV